MIPVAAPSPEPSAAPAEQPTLRLATDTAAAPGQLVQPTMEGMERWYGFSFLLTNEFRLG